jgi:hypothetical protein
MCSRGGHTQVTGWHKPNALGKSPYAHFLREFWSGRGTSGRKAMRPHEADATVSVGGHAGNEGTRARRAAVVVKG